MTDERKHQQQAEGAGCNLSPRERIMARALLECYWEWIDAGRPMREGEGRPMRDAPMDHA